MQLVKQPDFLRSLLVVTMLRSATYCLDAGFNTFFSYGYEFLCKRRLLHFFVVQAATTVVFQAATALVFQAS